MYHKHSYPTTVFKEDVVVLGEKYSSSCGYIKLKQNNWRVLIIEMTRRVFSRPSVSVDICYLDFNKQTKNIMSNEKNLNIIQ